jgi:hypothetical protein
LLDEAKHVDGVLVVQPVAIRTSPNRREDVALAVTPAVRANWPILSPPFMTDIR